MCIECPDFRVWPYSLSPAYDYGSRFWCYFCHWLWLFHTYSGVHTCSQYLHSPSLDKLKLFGSIHGDYFIQSLWAQLAWGYLCFWNEPCSGCFPIFLLCHMYILLSRFILLLYVNPGSVTYVYWESYLTKSFLHFLLYKVGIIIALISKAYCKDETG